MQARNNKKTSRNTVDALVAATAAVKYRQRRQQQGYAPLQVWVPEDMRPVLLELVHSTVEKLLAAKVPLESTQDGAIHAASSPIAGDRSATRTAAAARRARKP